MAAGTTIGAVPVVPGPFTGPASGDNEYANQAMGMSTLWRMWGVHF
jgi:hypothetical protein